jgi:hypothetical protein
MRIVQALHWLKDTLPSDCDRIQAKLSALLADPTHGAALRDGLRKGMAALPAWMQAVLRDHLSSGPAHPSIGLGGRRPVASAAVQRPQTTLKKTLNAL